LSSNSYSLLHKRGVLADREELHQPDEGAEEAEQGEELLGGEILLEGGAARIVNFGVGFTFVVANIIVAFRLCHIHIIFNLYRLTRSTSRLHHLEMKFLKNHVKRVAALRHQQ